MAKLYGISGKATGKKGDTVFTVRNGEQIIRQYNPIVSNPNTPAQVNCRAKLKLMSQLGAVLGSNIAIARQGTVSPRNLFTKVNIANVDADGGEAKIDLADLQLTKSAVGMTAVTASRSGSTAIAAACASSVYGQFDKVAFVLVEIGADSKVRVLDEAVVTVTEEAPTAAATLAYTGNAATVLAYGIKENSGKARAAFENLSGDATEHVAQLVATRTLSSSDVTLSETKGVNLASL